MGFLILLRLSLLCIDFLAWPVLALGFPLFASIRAIETGSVYHMRKLITYWTLFSIVSLFEYAFMKVIEWIPFWSSIKLVAIFWLVIPRFHGAYYAYQCFVRPFLVVKLQEAIDSLYKLKEKQTREKERFLDLAEKYIQENGSEALEKLIATKVKSCNGSEALEKLVATKMELKVPDNSQKDTQVIIEPDEKDVAPAPIKIKEPDAAQKYKETLEVHEIRSPEAKQVPHPRLLNTTTTSLWVPKETTYEASITKDIITSPPPREPTGSENRQTTSLAPLKKVEPKLEWYCSLCHLTCQCEIVFNSHLQGKKHLKKLKQIIAQDHTGPGVADNNAFRGKPKQKFEVWCSVCKLISLSEAALASHLKGKRHLSKVRKMAEEETNR